LKQLSIFIGTVIIFSTTACNYTTEITNKFVQNQEVSKILIIDGGNPEVYNKKMNICFSLRNKTKAQCLNKIYKAIDILVLQNNDKPIILAGRSIVKEKNIILKKEEKRILIYINTKNVKQPIKLNIKSLRKVKNGDTTILDIEIKNIEDTLTIRDREGKLLLKYNIIK